ncbi:MAG: hypothetical protein ACE5EQ_04030 [Phycisphaerae bacterium]
MGFARLPLRYVRCGWHRVVRTSPESIARTYREIMQMQEYEQLKQLIESCAEDVAKAEGGNKAAGTRVRKAMQDIKNAAQVVRKTILEVRSSEP